MGDKGRMIENGAELWKSMARSCSNEGFEYTIGDTRDKKDTIDERFRAHEAHDVGTATCPV